MIYRSFAGTYFEPRKISCTLERDRECDKYWQKIQNNKWLILIKNEASTNDEVVFDAGGVEQRSDLLPQLPPRPGAELEVPAEVLLYDLEGQSLLLQCLEVLTGEVTADVRLHPGDDLAQTLVTELLHLTQDSGAEEYLLFFWFTNVSQIIVGIITVALFASL